MLLTLSSIALDPNIKLAYAESKWDTKYYKDGLERLESVVRLLHLS